MHCYSIILIIHLLNMNTIYFNIYTFKWKKLRKKRLFLLF